MNINSMIDSTLLKQEATERQIDALCEEAIEHGFAAVCVQPCHIEKVAKRLQGSGVKACTVIGFPQGVNMTSVKAYEAERAVLAGAEELDMVINVGLLKDKQYDAVREDIAAVVNAARGAVVKVILECCLLTDEEIITACKLAKEAKADFVKTSTGLSTGGATAHDVQLMREAVGPDMGVKAAGGIRDRKTAIQMIEAGANRIGTSNGAGIVE